MKTNDLDHKLIKCNSDIFLYNQSSRTTSAPGVTEAAEGGADIAMLQSPQVLKDWSFILVKVQRN